MTKTGAGATLLDDPERACRIVYAVAERGRRARDREDAPRAARRLADVPRVGPRLVEAGAATLTLHPRSAKQMYTGIADHSLTAELVELRRRPGVASGDVDSRARAQEVLATTGAAAVMIGRGAQGNPWALREILGERRDEPTREEVAAELILFIRETVRELGERRASGFLKKFYGWYLGRGRFPRPFKQELVVLDSTDEVDRAAARRRARRSRGARAARGRAAGRRRPAARAADLDLRRRLSAGTLGSAPRRAAAPRA